MKNITTTGIDGLDCVLNGGFPVESTILLEGAPGTGKTILGMQFLYQGVIQNNEPGVYITFEEFPEQIYREMLDFGWNIKALEKENKMRVICLSPDILLEQMKSPNGLFEQIIKEINCKRIVIDSLNLFHFGMDDLIEKRKTIYTLRNILRKYTLTTLLIHEQTTNIRDEIPFESYVVDGVIRLSLQKHNHIYRKRTLEVLKMRGCKISEGEHIYRINETGINLIPALTMIEDRAVTQNHENIPTGISAIDRLLYGGIPRGSTFILDTNSKANYKYFGASIVTSRIAAGDKIIVLLSSLTTILDLEHIYRLYGIDLHELVIQEKVYFIEHYDRPIPNGYDSAVIKVGHLSNDEFRNVIQDKLGPIVEETLKRGEDWFIYQDINTLVSLRGKEFMNSYFTEEVAKTSSTNITIVALCNFTEIGPETSSFLERTSNGVFQTWVDGNYQYFQLKKSPQGNMSQPLIVENIQAKPFVRLV